MFGNMEEMQKEMKVKLAAIEVQAEAGDGAVQVSVNANRVVTNIRLDAEKLDLSDTDQLEDLVMVAINRALELAATKEQEEAQGMLKHMLPGGLGNLFGK
ncbi:MAG: YbaB/EbfC family nucleoid-associated protein [Saprospiraceae bacterium]|nr:YbaB/EbfC family nucleoid-associated protein [Saprospiraceae bacterium]